MRLAVLSVVLLLLTGWGSCSTKPESVPALCDAQCFRPCVGEGEDMIKAGRYATLGVNTLRGDPVLEDVSPWQVLLQGAGFSPAEVAERYERNRALKNYEEHITKRRQSLMNAYAMAIRNGDAADRVAVMEKVRAFNKANPELAISSDSIRASLKSRARYSAKAEAGIVINPKLAARLQERVGPAE